MLKRFIVVLLGLGLMLSGAVPLLADRGMIPIGPDISVYEPGQKAIIAWKAGKEIMILSTDVRATAQTKVLEILPLPAMPQISAGDFRSFEEIQKLIYQHVPPVWRGPMPPGVEILFHEKIGAHEITVVKANDYEEFLRWAKDFVGEVGVSFPSRLQTIVGDYIRDGMSYFVFDIIEVTQEEKSVEPLVYEFESPFLYYPLRISTLMPGETKIQLFLITEDVPDDLSRAAAPLTLGHYSFGYPIQFAVSGEDLQRIEPRIAKLFSSRAWLSALWYEGPLESFTADLTLPSIEVLSADIQIRPASPTTEDEIEVTVTITFSREFGNECFASAHISDVTREGNIFSIVAGEIKPDVVCILVYKPTKVGRRTYQLGKLEAGSYLFSVYDFAKLFTSKPFSVAPPDRTIERALDLNENNRIDEPELIRAIDLWIRQEAVPGSGGQKISDAKIIKLLDLWVRGEHFAPARA